MYPFVDGKVSNVPGNRPLNVSSIEHERNSQRPTSEECRNSVVSRKFHQQQISTGMPRFSRSSSQQEAQSLTQRNHDRNEDKNEIIRDKFQQYEKRQHYFHVNSSSVSQLQKTPTQKGLRTSTHHKRQVSTKTYRHGLTVQELKEMTKARLAAEANGKQLSDQNSGMQRRPNFNESDVLMNRSLHDVSWKNEMRERVDSYDDSFHSDAAIRQRLNSTETSSSAPPATVWRQKYDLTNTHQDDSNKYSRNDATLRMYQVPQQQAGLPHSSSLISQDRSALSTKRQDLTMSIHNSFSNDGFDSNSVHSFSSAVGSDYLGSENSGFPASQRQQKHSSASVNRSMSYPVGADSGDSLESPNTFDGTSICGRNNATTLPPPELSHLYENKPLLSDGDLIQAYRKLGSISHSHASKLHEVESTNSHISSPASVRGEEISNDRYCSIFGQSSSETEPTITLSADSFCDENNITLCHRNISDGVVSRNGELPNSVAESVLKPAAIDIDFFDGSDLMKNSMGRRASYDTERRNHSGKPSLEGSDIAYNSGRPSSDQSNLAQFLDDYEFRLSFDAITEHPSSSLFVSKIDPEVTNAKGIVSRKAISSSSSTKYSNELKKNINTKGSGIFNALTAPSTRFLSKKGKRKKNKK